MRLPSRLKEVRDTIDASCGSFMHAIHYMNGDYAPHYPMPAICLNVSYGDNLYPEVVIHAIHLPDRHNMGMHGFECVYIY